MIVMMSGRVSPRWSPGGSMRGSEEEEEEEKEERRRRGGTRPVLGARLGPSPPPLPHSTAHSVPTRLSWGMLTLLDRVQWCFTAGKSPNAPSCDREREAWNLGTFLRVVWIVLKMIGAAGHLFFTLATLLTGQSQVVLLSANYGAIFTKELISIQKW